MGGGPRLFAALDLGTNNCRLLIAAPQRTGFRAVEGYSKIVRLGEGLGVSGRLSEAAMERTISALQTCAQRIAERGVTAVGCIATAACRVAENGAEFLERVQRETGLSFRVISPEEEARLAALGCANLVDPAAEAALIVDVGGGSTEMSWLDAHAASRIGGGDLGVQLHAWGSRPVGVVTLAESAPESGDADAWFAELVATARAQVAALSEDDAGLKALMASDRAHIIGASGTVTCLAGVHLDLKRYQRSRIDGVWLSRDDCVRATAKLLGMSRAERGAHPCIGAERADLIVPGCAILAAILEAWPARKLRVADRGLREGVLMTLMAAKRGS
ncbi:MAG: Ppx/GppA family phosphatase [Hyphomonadaceae bacterium]|nr:Ppx/GppA family phosphatase [Hyphomonadaceae bacterium]